MLTVSNYHYIRESFDSKYPSIFGMTPQQFKKQLSLLKNDGQFIRPQDFILNMDHVLKSKENYILITFDDGLKEQYNYALPILDEIESCAIFFANTINSQEHKVTLVHKIHLLRSIISPADLLKQLFF